MKRVLEERIELKSNESSLILMGLDILSLKMFTIVLGWPEIVFL